LRTAVLYLHYLTERWRWYKSRHFALLSFSSFRISACRVLFLALPFDLKFIRLPMRLRSRMVVTDDEDESAVSASPDNMDDSSSVEAVVGSPATRRRYVGLSNLSCQSQV
jgi:hypothetical protein